MTTAAAAAAGSIGVAYREHEIANDIKSEAAVFDSTYHDAARTAEMKGLARVEETKAIELLGIAVFLGTIAGGAYFDDKHSKPKPAQVRKAKATS